MPKSVYWPVLLARLVLKETAVVAAVCTMMGKPDRHSRHCWKISNQRQAIFATDEILERKTPKKKTRTAEFPQRIDMASFYFSFRNNNVEGSIRYDQK